MMEDSTFEAMHVAVSIFVFIIAISATIYLFSSISELSERSYEYGKVKVDAAVSEQVPSENAVILDSSQVIAYYFNYVKKDLYLAPDATVKQEYNVEITTIAGVKLSNTINNNLDYQAVLIAVGSTRKYMLEYTSRDTSGATPVATINIKPV